MIYFVQSGEEGVIKIGCTNACVGGRVKAMQFASPYEIKFLGCHDGGHDVERNLHHRFKENRFRGEWFHPVIEILEYISENADTTPLYDLLRYDLREAVSAKARRKWTAEDRSDYEILLKSIKSNRYKFDLFMRWSAGLAVPSKDAADALETFLSERDLYKFVST